MATTVTRARIDLPAARKSLTDMYEGLLSVVGQITEDHRKLNVCTNYSQFQKDLPAAWLERAGERLKKKEYKVAFVGPFKAGKSTFLSALLKQPGMLPAEDAECTFSVGVVSAPGPGEPEHVKVTYYTAEEALRNILTHSRYFKLFEFDKKTHEELLRNFAADRAIEFIRDAAAKGAAGDRKEEAGELSDPDKGFIAAYKKYRDRLGKTHPDAIDNLKTYVRKEEGIGHLLLIKLVEIYRNNPVLAKQGFQIADTPGTDSMNEAARAITLSYLKEADAVIYLAEARGLSTNFNVIREELTKFHNDIREKMFIVANKADWYEIRSMRKEGSAKAPIEVVFENIVNPLRALGLNENKLFFTAGRMSELGQKKDAGTLTPDEAQQHAIMQKTLQEKLDALAPGLNPVLLRQLQTCFRDGGVDAFRQVVIDYLEYDIQAERLKEVFLDLDRAYGAVKRLLDPEQSRLKEILSALKPKSQQITEFFEQAKNQFLDKVSVMSTGAPNALNALMDKAREQIETTVTTNVERLNIDRTRARLRVPTPLNVKMEVIHYFKGDLSGKFTQIVRDTISPVFRAKLNEQVTNSRVGEVLEHLAKGFGGEFDVRFEGLMDRFNTGLDQFTIMRAREETWEMIDTEMKPASFEVEWSPSVEAEFRNDLKSVFTERFVDYCGKLRNTLARHYQGFIQDLFQDFEKLLDEVSAAIKKDPDRVSLPEKILTGATEETEEEKRRRCILNYFRTYDAVNKLREALAPSFPTEN